MDDPIRCDDCGEQVRAARKDNGRLTMVCDCYTHSDFNSKNRPVKVSSVIPEAWL